MPLINGLAAHQGFTARTCSVSGRKAAASGQINS
jgi:hypothetical protein